MSNNTGISFFNSHNGELRAFITHINEHQELFIQLIRYSDNVSVISICLDPMQIDALQELLSNYQEHLIATNENK
jgi:hypothetical protein